MRIAVFLPNWIGDVVMATPAIAALHARYPHSKMVAVGKPYVEAVTADSPWFENFWPLERTIRSGLAVARQLRSYEADAAVLFPNSFRVAAVARAGRCKLRIGFVRYARGFLLTNRFYPVQDEKGKFVPRPILRDYNRIVQVLGAEPTDRMELFTSDSQDAQATGVLNQLGIQPNDEVIGLNPGAAFGASKFWPTAYFAELARKFVDSRNAKVVVMCGPNEKDISREIAAQSGRSTVKSLADFPLSIGFSKAIVKKLDLLVTTDSGPRHFAAAFNRPVVTLFGPTHIEWTETFYDKAIHLQKKVPCGPCQLRVCPTDHRCMKELSVAEVFEASCKLLPRHDRGGLRHAG
jgi:heptosyltransferase-2